MNGKEICGTYTQWSITQPLKEYIWTSSTEVDEAGADYTEWGKFLHKVSSVYSRGL